MQTKLESILESALNTISAYIISTLSFYFVVPLFVNVHPTIGDANQVTLFYTAISICRNYIWRRIFNHRIEKNWRKIYGESAKK